MAVENKDSTNITLYSLFLKIKDPLQVVFSSFPFKTIKQGVPALGHRPL